MARTGARLQALRCLPAAILAAMLFLYSAMPAKAEPLEQRIQALAPHLTVSRPEGEGPFPVLFMLHGCGGPRPFLQEITEVAVAEGAAVVNINSYGHRRIGQMRAYATVCTGAQLHGRERAGDLYAAMAWARRQPWADGARFAAIGWSHGGWTILDALSLRSGPEMARATGLEGLSDEPLEGLAAAMVVYPYTGIGSLVGRRAWRISPRVIAIVAEHDYIVGDARGALERQRARGALLDIVIFENATHAFEDAHAADLRVRYNGAATKREHDMLRALIAGL